jgi:hypothetical protein
MVVIPVAAPLQGEVLDGERRAEAKGRRRRECGRPSHVALRVTVAIDRCGRRGIAEWHGASPALQLRRTPR